MLEEENIKSNKVVSKLRKDVKFPLNPPKTSLLYDEIHDWENVPNVTERCMVQW